MDILNRKQSFLDETIIKKIFLFAFFTEILSENNVFDILERKEKIEVLTRTKKWTFFEGVSPWILSKNRTFSYLPFSQKFYQKTTFLIFWKEKNDFKRKKSKF